MRANFLLGRLTVAVLLATAGLVVPLVAAPPASAVPTIVYVVEGGAGTQDGSSWANGKQLFQATADAVAGQELWVKAGNHVPGDLGLGAHFQLKSGVAIYGGFDGTETSRAQRDPAANVTVLNGDVDGDGTEMSNSSHVVIGTDTDDTAILDGFTIENGYAGAFNTPEERGAGIYLDNSDARLSNLSIIDNQAVVGAGLWALDSNPHLTDVTMSGNHAGKDAGGIWISGGSLTMDRVTMSGNSSLYSGGAIVAGGTEVTITGSTITGNTANGEGQITTNGGGGIYAENGSLTVRDTTLSGNSIGGVGGAIYYKDFANTYVLDLANVAIKGNKAINGWWQGVGGGVYIDFGKSKLTDVVLSGNKAALEAGAVFNRGDMTLTNTTIAGNTSPGAGGIRNEGVTPVIRNSILWGNGDSYSTNGALTWDMQHSIIQGEGAVPGAGNVFTDPMFTTAVPSAPSTGGNLLPQAGSPTVDAGNNADLPAGVTTDVAGHPRIVSGTVDIGAYERQSAGATPTVTSTTPSNGAPVTSVFKATFSETVTGISAATFKVTVGGAAVPGTVTRTATSATFTPTTPLIPGEHYTASLLAGIKDVDGNPVAPTTWTIRTSVVVDNSSPALVDVWDRDAAAGASGGFYSAANQTGYKVALRFTGTNVTVLGTRAPDGGLATVLLDGVSVGAANFYAATRHDQVAVFSRTGLTNTAHTLELRVRGTKSAASTDTWVNVDAFKVGAATFEENSTRVRDYFTRDAGGAGPYGRSLEDGWHATTGDTGARPAYRTTCRGTDLKVYAATTPDSGKVAVYVDNVLKTIADLRAPLQYRALIYDSAPLTDARHVVRIDVVGTGSGLGSDTAFDYLRCG
ncbi:Ig-like domain-containing protein [Nocardioides sp. MH1]|uniref:Ig-like domain-containing protein n=1 Tax=Nocardioides sp. MH1 TaxID=3242490 RepID=UPI00352099F8